EARERVMQLVFGAPDELGRGFGEDSRELCGGLRLPRGEERDVVAPLDEPVGEQRDDPFDAAITRRRHREPHWAQDRDLHASSMRTCPSSRRTSHTLSKARTPASLSEPAHEGNSGGAIVASVWTRWSG